MRPSRSRRGVLLLLILALLAMFGLIGVAFVVLTGQAQRGAKSIERIDLAVDPPQNLLHQAAMQVFRGSTNPASVMGAHSLLEDIYGNNTATGTFGTATPICGGQLWEIPASGISILQRGGCVLTITAVLNAAQRGLIGQSTRIVGFNPTNNNPQILAFSENNIDPSGASFVINGVPFSGTGFGWDLTTGTITATALQPNNPANHGALVSANEDYDAADFQNMLLAALDENGRVVIPSLHRPDLCNYQQINNPSLAANTYILRPLAANHPNFTGSNPNFDPTGKAANARWDVDNDGDGVADSVWVDLGMPPRATADGRLYKPLFAILCLDLDGRLNLNAHGNMAQATGTMTNTASDARFAGGAGANLPRGVGYGPAEINLSAIPSLPYQQLLQYRYAASGWFSGNAARYLYLNKWFLYGGDYWSGTANSTGAYGSPPDLLGTAGIGIDWGGRPIYVDMGQQLANTPSPYEYDLSANRQRGAANNTQGNVPFSAAELERILRPYDRDATSLPNRLQQLAGAVLLNHRHAVTTESWDVPVPSVGVSADIVATKLLDQLPEKRPQNIGELLAVLLMKASSGLTLPQAQALLTPNLFAPEVLAGRKMDLNRILGDGRDNNNTNNVVDEQEPAETDQVTFYTTAVGGTASTTVSRDPRGTALTPLEARQLVARYLYVLAMLLADREALRTQMDPILGRAATAEDVARFLAQWAVNVVDFYDRDSIMTPFKYDPNPFTSSGWQADNNLTTNTEHIVWGCERPELLITETLAFHDRRTEDLDTDTTPETETGDTQKEGGKTTDTDPDKKDASFDQCFKPQGSLFIELYNPSTTQEPLSGELNTATVNGGINLNRTSTTGNSPVWRLIIVDQANATKDPDAPVAADQPTIERAVYFVSTGTLPSGGTIQFKPATNQAGRIAPIMPGRYALIGSGDPDDTAESITYLGFKNNENPGTVTPTSTRRIVLNPNSNEDTTNQVGVYNNGTVNDLTGFSIKNPTAIVINSPQRLSISEPDEGYDSTNYDAATGYTPPHDIPLDESSTLSAEMKAAIRDNKRTDSIKVVHLQRLANPLVAYNANSNPYRTVDSMPIDLTAFNGISSDADPKAPTPISDIQFYARQRGHNSTSATHNLWRQEPLTGTAPKQNTTPPATGSGFIFNNALHHTLAFLNNPFGAPSNAPGAIGDPTSPFPWLTWFNRPFVSQLELTLVPWAKSSQLCRFFDLGTADSYDNLFGRFPHLINMLQSNASGTSGSKAQLHRILEFVAVPSRFVGTEIQINPDNTAGSHIFHPPYNRIPTMREPGKINLNTIFSEEVYNGLMNGCPGPTWAEFQASRAGLFATSPDTCPTRFARPFRSFAGANLTPDFLKPNREINATLLREGSGGQPLFRFGSSSDYNNPDRNPFFYYHGLQRLANLVTTRSNVYAVWITVGYFEFNPANNQLGRELGVDTGEIERHRAFYIFDRSIPVGFQRGQDLNVEKAILVRRFIE